jgi:hypothetical protein
MWRLLADTLAPDTIASMSAGTIGLDDLDAFSSKMIGGEVAGRLLVDVRGTEP